MTTRTVLDNVKHRNLKVGSLVDLTPLRNTYLVPLTVHEFEAAAMEHFIFFAKNESTGEFQPVALLGTEPGENLFSHNNDWVGLYLPRSLKYSAFSLARTERSSDECIVTIDESSPVFSGEFGEPLFTEQGDQTAYLESLVNELTRHIDSVTVTKEFAKLMVRFDLLEQKSLTLSIDAHEDRNIQGVYVINQAKLDQLDHKEFGQLREIGALPLIYAQLSSMHQALRLTQLKKASLERAS